MADKLGSAGLTFNERLAQTNQGVNQMKYSVIVPGTKSPTQGGLSFAQKQDMSKSVIQRESNQDIEAFIKQTKMKFLRMEQALSDHDGQLKQLRSGKSYSSYSMSTSNSTDSFSVGLANDLRNDFNNNTTKLRTTMYQQIDRVRAQITEGFIRKNDLNFALQKLEGNLKNMGGSRQISQLKEKINFECRSIYQRISQDFGTKLDQTRLKFNETEQQINELRRKIDALKQQTKPTIFTSNQKCYSPRLVKYKQIFQKLPNNSYDKSGQEIVINQMIYYLDKQGRLLDSSNNYLLDKNNKQIQLDYKQMTILNVHDMLT